MLVLVLLAVALVSALTAMRFAIHGREVVVPKLVGMTPAEADRTAQASGLLLEVERQYYSPNVPEGRVMSQVPAAGTKVRHGWQVRVAQSLGPQR
ncbi:MAG: penicillin-binding protein, partial [Acidobacteria bacterium]